MLLLLLLLLLADDEDVKTMAVVGRHGNDYKRRHSFSDQRSPQIVCPRLYAFWPRKLLYKRGMCYRKVCLSVRPTRESRLNGSS